MLHLIYLQFSEPSYWFLFLLRLYLCLLFFVRSTYCRLRHILTIIQSFLSRIYLFLFWLRNFRSWFNLISIDTLHLACELLNKTIITCILSNFFFFSTQSSPPMLAPRPPNRTHSLLEAFFLSTLLE